MHETGGHNRWVAVVAQRFVLSAPEFEDFHHLSKVQSQDTINPLAFRMTSAENVTYNINLSD